MVDKLEEIEHGSCVTCDKCEGVLFTLKWFFYDPPQESGLFACCAGCGTVRPIVKAVYSRGKVA
jgi:hypothetical protein